MFNRHFEPSANTHGQGLTQQTELIMSQSIPRSLSVTAPELLLQ